MGNHISSLQTGAAAGPLAVVAHERRECFLSDSVPAGFHDFTAHLARLEIRLPGRLHLVVQKDSETLIHLREALACLNHFIHATPAQRLADPTRVKALEAGALLLRVGALDHLFPHTPLQSGDKVLLPVSDALPDWMRGLLQSPGNATPADDNLTPQELSLIRHVLNDSPLHVAALQGKLERVLTLLGAGFDVDYRDTHGRTALHAAALKNHLPVVNALLRAGAPVDVADEAGCTPLVLAVQADSLKALGALLRAKANVDVITREGHTPLTIAAALGKAQAMQSLLEAGAKPDFAGSAGRPLHYAVLRGEPAGVARLLEAGADTNAASDWHLYCGETTPPAPPEQQKITPLELATLIGSIKILRLLQARGADVLAVGPTGVPLIVRAASAGEINILNHLLEAGAGPNDADPLGRGPLSWAAGNARFAVFKRLLAKGAEPLASDRQGNSVLHWAVAASTADNQAAKNAIATLLLKQPGVNVDERNQRSETPLHLAAMGDAAELIKTLLDAGARPELKDHRGRTALHCAAALGSIEGVRHLIEAGAWVNEPDQTGCTPLHYASQRGDADVVWLLVSRGADVTIRNRDRRLPGYFAAHGGHIEVAQALAGQEVVSRSVGPGVPAPLKRAQEIGRVAIKQFVEKNFGPSAPPDA